jgi:hypothetical protein
LAVEHNALRLTPDEWMIPLFGEPEGDGKRDVLKVVSTPSTTRRASAFAPAE